MHRLRLLLLHISFAVTLFVGTVQPTAPAQSIDDSYLQYPTTCDNLTSCDQPVGPWEYFLYEDDFDCTTRSIPIPCSTISPNDYTPITLCESVSAHQCGVTADDVHLPESYGGAGVLGFKKDHRCFTGTSPDYPVADRVFQTPTTKDTVRVWTAPDDGEVVIDLSPSSNRIGAWAHSDTLGDGKRILIYRYSFDDSTNDYVDQRLLLLNTYVPFDARVGRETAMTAEEAGFPIHVRVNEHDRIAFHVNRNALNGWDTVVFDPRVTFTPAAGTYSLGLTTTQSPTDFAGTTQGVDNWYYGRIDATDLTDSYNTSGMVWRPNASTPRWKSDSSQLFLDAGQQKPHGSEAACRIWVAPHDGWCQISSDGIHLDPLQGQNPLMDGVTVQLLHHSVNASQSADGTILWTGDVDWQDNLSQSFYEPLFVNEGDKLVVRVAPKANAISDRTVLNISIDLDPTGFGCMTPQTIPGNDTINNTSVLRITQPTTWRNVHYQIPATIVLEADLTIEDSIIELMGTAPQEYNYLWYQTSSGDRVTLTTRRSIVGGTSSGGTVSHANFQMAGDPRVEWGLPGHIDGQWIAEKTVIRYSAAIGMHGNHALHASELFVGDSGGSIAMNEDSSAVLKDSYFKLGMNHRLGISQCGNESYDFGFLDVNKWMDYPTPPPPTNNFLHSPVPTLDQSACPFWIIRADGVRAACVSPMEPWVYKIESEVPANEAFGPDEPVTCQLQFRGVDAGEMSLPIWDYDAASLTGTPSSPASFDTGNIRWETEGDLPIRQWALYLNDENAIPSSVQVSEATRVSECILVNGSSATFTGPLGGGDDPSDPKYTLECLASKMSARDTHSTIDVRRARVGNFVGGIKGQLEAQSGASITVSESQIRELEIITTDSGSTIDFYGVFDESWCPIFSNAAVGNDITLNGFNGSGINFYPPPALTAQYSWTAGGIHANWRDWDSGSNGGFAPWDPPNGSVLELSYQDVAANQRWFPRIVCPNGSYAFQTPDPLYLVVRCQILTNDLETEGWSPTLRFEGYESPPQNPPFWDDVIAPFWREMPLDNWQTMHTYVWNLHNPQDPNSKVAEITNWDAQEFEGFDENISDLTYWSLWFGRKTADDHLHLDSSNYSSVLRIEEIHVTTNYTDYTNDADCDP